MVKRFVPTKKECAYFSIVNQMILSNLRILLFTSVILTVGCNSNDDFLPSKEPKNLLSEDKFIAVFSDMILLESTAMQDSPNINHTHKMMNVASPEVLKKHHVSKKEYAESFEYYAQDKEKMEEIYTKILDDYNIKLSKLK